MANGRGGQAAVQSVELASTGVATGLFIAAAAANAVPVGGQIAAAGLAIAAGLMKAFVGKKQKREAERRAQATAQRKQNVADVGQSIGGGQAMLGGGVPQQQMQQQGPTNVQQPQAPVYDNYNSPGAAPTVTPQRLGNG